MTVTPRDLSVLAAVARYYTLTRTQLTALCFPDDAGGRVTRKRLDALVSAGLLNRTRMAVVNPAMGAPQSVYYPSAKGCEYLAAQDGDARVRSACTRCPDWTHLYHWTQVAELHLRLDRAVALQAEVAVEHWLSEWDVANPDESAPEKRYRLFTLLSESPRLVCAPDAGFVLAARGHRKGMYVELDRMTSGVKQIAASKTKGYEGLAERRLHRRHFPGVAADAPFAVLHVSPTRNRRDQVARAVAEKGGAHLWRFAAWTDWTPEALLHEPILTDCAGKELPLVRRATPPPDG